MLRYLLLLLNLYYSNSFIFNFKNKYNFKNNFLKKINSNNLCSLSLNHKNDISNIKNNNFDFEEQWYPIAVDEFLNKKKIHKFKLLGKDLLLWHDKEKWIAFEDICPHRLAPLSEGRIEDNQLMCSYHAWKFNSNGNCSSIPHADIKKEKKQISHINACAKTHPVKEEQFLIWVWGKQGNSGTLTAIKAALKEPILIEELKDNNSKILPINIRNIPYSWDMWFENILDPSHAYITHHNILGNRYNSPIYYNLINTEKMTKNKGFKQKIEHITNKTHTINIGNVIGFNQEFIPPCLAKLTILFENNIKLCLILYGTPSEPGHVITIGYPIIYPNINNTNILKNPIIILNYIVPFIPKWLSHILSSLFLHQDLVLLHQQEKILKQKNYNFSNRYSDIVYTPTPHDNGPIKFREWLYKYAKNGLPYLNSEKYNTNLKKEDLFDVYNTHTKDCTVCMDALINLKIIRNSLYFFGFISMVLRTNENFNLFFIGLLLIGLGLTLNRLIDLFYKYEFEHYLND